MITEPMPSMPVGFWNDPDGARYREAYFDVYPGVWRHGDWITITERGALRHHRPLRRHPQPRRRAAGHHRVLLGGRGARRGAPTRSSCTWRTTRAAPASCCCSWCCADGLELDDALRARIAGELRTALSPRHVPDEIYQVRAVPRTLSAKKLEVPVKRILTGTPVDQAAAKGALANPESLTAFDALAQHAAAAAPTPPALAVPSTCTRSDIGLAATGATGLRRGSG